MQHAIKSIVNTLLYDGQVQERISWRLEASRPLKICRMVLTLKSVIFYPLNDRGVNWLHFAI